MANRTMLIAANKVPMDSSGAGLKTIGLSEFNYDIPLIYRVLVSEKPQLCHSTVFELDEPIAIAGNAKGGLERLTKLRDKLPKDAENLHLIDQAIEFLTKTHHDYPYFLLEPAEVYSMNEGPIAPMVSGLLRDIKKLNMRQVKRTAAGAQNHSDWAANCWSNVLYFEPRGAVSPPVEFDRSYLSLTTQQVVDNVKVIISLTALEDLRLKTQLDDPNLDPALKILGRIEGEFYLTISGQAHELPDSIGGLTGVSGLSIHSLGLKTLPPSLQKLTHITKLIVSHNALSEIPEFLSSMSSQFSVMNLSENQISAVPDWIHEFSKLEELNLMGNPISSLPSGVWGMENLKNLYVGFTKMTSLPEAISGLVSLTLFNAEGLGLTELPDAFWSLSNLSGVNLQNNSLGSNLPNEGLRMLVNLENINLRKCEIVNFPEAFCDLPNLVRIDLRLNHISSVPNCARQKKLDWIGLQGNPHRYTPADFNADAIGL